MLVKDMFEIVKKVPFKWWVIIWVTITFLAVYNSVFRYDYKIYNMPGKDEARIKIVKLDRLTGKYEVKIVVPDSYWDKFEEVKDYSKLSDE